jgi:DNA-binding winged helix-turn-helix (wHTH) protein
MVKWKRDRKSWPTSPSMPGHTSVALQERPLQVLDVLLRTPGELVTREAVQHELWGGDTFVDFETGLNAAVRRLREALSDSADTPRCIETHRCRAAEEHGPRSGWFFSGRVSHTEVGPNPLVKRPRLDDPPAGAGGAGGENRTLTPLAGLGILSPVRLPVSPPRRRRQASIEARRATRRGCGRGWLARPHRRRAHGGPRSSGTMCQGADAPSAPIAQSPRAANRPICGMMQT